MSSDRLIIFETLTPAAGSNSFSVTTGPWLTFLIFPSTPKSRRIFSKKSVLIKSSFLDCPLSFFEGNFNKSIDGNLNFNFFIFSCFSDLIKGKSSCIRFLISF